MACRGMVRLGGLCCMAGRGWSGLGRVRRDVVRCGLVRKIQIGG